MDNAQNISNNEIDIRVKEDGVYLYIRHPEGSPWVSRMEVLALIEAYGVLDVDFVTLNDTLKNETPLLEVKISNNTQIIQKDEAVSIEISKDRMEAYVTFTEPVNKGRLLTTDELLILLQGAGIVNVSRLKAESILRNKRYDRKYIIAEGTVPIPGTDGFLQYHFDNSNLRPKPKIMDDGSVNFRQLGLVRLCNRGDVLVTSVQPKDGVNGMDVTGNILPYPKGRLPMPMPKGRNTVISDDGLHLIADASGQLVILDAKINISPCLEIKGNVDNSTGDIDFNGMVTVRGNVITGFTVKAVGNIEVFGVCEGATLITEGSITLAGGAQGSDKAVITADGDITAKFIESCKVTAGGNIVADSIMKSIVKCNGNVTLTGKNGLLVGGSLIAGNKLIAKTIGSPMGTQTLIEVGSNPNELVRHHELTAEHAKLKGDYEKCDQAVNTLSMLKQKGQLSDDKKNLLLKMINTKIMIRDKLNKLQNEIDELTQLLTSNTGSVSASKRIRPGVCVTIGSAQLTIRDELQNCTLRNNGAKIAIGPCV